MKKLLLFFMTMFVNNAVLLCGDRHQPNFFYNSTTNLEKHEDLLRKRRSEELEDFQRKCDNIVSDYQLFWCQEQWVKYFRIATMVLMENKENAANDTPQPVLILDDSLEMRRYIAGDKNVKSAYEKNVEKK